MAPPKKFTKEEIIQVAFEIARREGLDAITIRKVAKELGSSIAPIYVNFSNVDELIEAVVRRAEEVAKQLVLEQNSGQPFRDIGIGGIKFARKYSVLYRDLVLKDNPHVEHNEEKFTFAVNQMKQDPALQGFSDEELKEIILKMDIFHTGLMVQVANGLFPKDISDEQLIAMLDSVAKDIVIAAKVKKEM